MSAVAVERKQHGMRYRPAGEIFDVVGGGTPSKKMPSYYGGDIPWATIRDMHSPELVGTEFTITREGLKKSSSRLIRAGEVVMACRVGLGKACILRQDTAINQDIRALIPRDTRKVDRRFCLYWLQSIERVIRGAGTGATVQGVKLPFIKSLPFPDIPLQEQQRIVAVLDQAFAALDRARARIEQSRRNTNEIFDSVLASVTGEQQLLGSLVTVRTGRLDANAAVEGGQYPFFTCSKDVYAIDRFAFDCEAILLAGNNAVGDFNVKHYQGKFNAYQRTYVITVNDTRRLLYRYLYFQLIKSLKHFKERSVGAGTKFLKLGMINGLRISVPTSAQQHRIVTILDALLEKTQHLDMLYSDKLTDLAALRQSLLQKAFAGELT